MTASMIAYQKAVDRFMRRLALDPATNTGWAYDDGRGNQRFGTWRLDVPKPKHAGERFRRLQLAILQVHHRWGIDEIVFEDAAYGSQFYSTKQFHNQMRGAISMAAAEIGAKYHGYVPTTIKKFATGHGHASKQDMIRAAKIQLGIDVQSEDACDAIWVLEYAKHRARHPELTEIIGAKKPKAKKQRRKQNP